MKALIKKVTHMWETKNPGVRRGTSTIHNHIYKRLKRLDVLFNRVWLLLMCFGEPSSNVQGLEIITDMEAIFGLGLTGEE